MCSFWAVVKEAFPEAWGKPPNKSRLMHSAGIKAMGTLMDFLMMKMQSGSNQTENFKEALNHMKPHCCWTEGIWEGLDWKWDEVQATPRHIRGLAENLIRLVSSDARQ